MQKYEPLYSQVRFRKGDLSSRFRTFQRFTRAKTIGEDYTEERLKERIAEREMIKTPPIKKRIGNIIDMNTNMKVKESKGYEYRATKHNLNTMAESVIFIREHGIKSVKHFLVFVFALFFFQRCFTTSNLASMDSSLTECITSSQVYSPAYLNFF